MAERTHAGLLYYLPGAKGCTPEILERFGLTELFRGGSPESCESAGPDGKGGVIVRVTPERPIDGAVKPRVGFFRDRQIWEEARAADGSGAYWLGREFPPLPVDLQRPELVGGHRVRLEDGNDWLVPCARVFPTGTNLPEAMSLGPNGEIVYEVLPRFIEISKRAARVWDYFQWLYGTREKEIEQITDREAFEIACAALGINYRIGLREASFLRLLSTRNYIRVLEALVDMPTVLERVCEAQAEKLPKKKGAEAID